MFVFLPRLSRKSTRDRRVLTDFSRARKFVQDYVPPGEPKQINESIRRGAVCTRLNTSFKIMHILSLNSYSIRFVIIIIRCQIWNRHWWPCLSKHLCHQTTSKNLNPYFVHLLPSYKDHQDWVSFLSMRFLTFV